MLQHFLLRHSDKILTYFPYFPFPYFGSMPKLLHFHKVNFINNCAFRLSVIKPKPRLPQRPIRTKSKYVTNNLKRGKTRMAESQLSYSAKWSKPIKSWITLDFHEKRLYSNLIYESEIVTNKHHSSFKVVDSVCQSVDGFHVQVISGFVK